MKLLTTYSDDREKKVAKYLTAENDRTEETIERYKPSNFLRKDILLGDHFPALSVLALRRFTHLVRVLCCLPLVKAAFQKQ